ncbi:MAG TPA: cupredoxin domain-containing protein [Hanamia sp.]|jgi:plastocyanin|nr:cupredoxin domain-containing protein [Hanamia sp.]
MKVKHFAMILVVSSCTLFFNSCSKSKNATTETTNGNTITITGMSFPATTTIKKGTVITWNNKDGIAHTVTSNDGITFDSGTLDPGGTFSFTANTVGSFPYHCNFHSMMKGTLVVTQ